MQMLTLTFCCESMAFHGFAALVRWTNWAEWIDLGNVHIRGWLLKIYALLDLYAHSLLHQTEGEGLRLDLLQRCIEAAMDVFTDVERRLCLREALHYAGGRAALQRPPGSVVHPWL